MHLDTIRNTVNGKTYTSHLLRETYRENGKVKHRTIANLSKCSPHELEAIRLALKHKGDLTGVGSLKDNLATEQGLSIGAVFLLHSVAKRLGIIKALGANQEGKRALWQIFARIIDQGSRLSAVRLASTHAACDVLGLNAFDEDSLYENLDWLASNQTKIENRLFRHRHPDGKAPLFLYDVTSSYLEGTDNELGAFGYNRDKKKGKQQIVIGLLCDEAGSPLSVEVFSGNTTDTSTFASQIRTVAQRFGGGEVTFVGDRGMIKGPQIEALKSWEDEKFHYITAITKPQIESLLKKGIFQMELFEETLVEVMDDDCRYVLRRNPVRAQEIAENRRAKVQSVTKLLQKQNQYLGDHARAKTETAIVHVKKKVQQLCLSSWITVVAEGRTLRLVQDQEVLAEQSKLDGCYCLKTDLKPKMASKEVVHDRYKNLAQVEWAFRTCKTAHLEARPIFVRKASRTRGHVLVVMLAYLIIAELTRCWHDLDLTVAEGIDELASLCMTTVTIKNQVKINQVPTPRHSVRELFKAAKITIPKVLPYTGAKVSTNKKLVDERKRL
jgi:transposase